MHIINKNTGALFLVAILEYGLEVNTENSKCVFTSREHQAEQHYLLTYSMEQSPS